MTTAQEADTKPGGFVMTPRPRSSFTVAAPAATLSWLGRPGSGVHARGIRPNMWSAAALLTARHGLAVRHAKTSSRVDWTRLRRRSAAAGART